MAIYVTLEGKIPRTPVWASQKISNANIPFLAAFGYCFFVSSIALFFLQLSVTKESIMDINGSSNFTYQISELKILGQLGAELIDVFGTNNFKALMSIIEPYIRFNALIGPFIYFYIISLISIKKANVTHNIQQYLLVYTRHFLIYIAYFSPWFLLCKLIAFDFSSTDNLNELIAREGNGVGGGGLYLYLLLILIVKLGVILGFSFLKSSYKKLAMVIVVVICSIPLTWLLLNLGLIHEFTKYHSTYSGVDFFLGPDRKTRLPEELLFFRWSLLHIGMVTFVSLGLVLFCQIFTIELNKNGSAERKPLTLKIKFSNYLPNVSSLIHHKFKFLFVVFIGITVIVWGTKDLSTPSSRSVTWAGNDATVIFDHHMHSTFSDGKLSVKDLVELSYLKGCNAIAITDHTDVKKSLTNQKFTEVAALREKYQGLLIFNGAELNIPSYQGREHVNILVSPDKEKDVLTQLMQKVPSIKKSATLQQDKELLQFLTSLASNENMLAIYNHPSRKDDKKEENYHDMVNWQEADNLFIGFAGAPGHQKANPIGGYHHFETINRWDPIVAEVGNVWDTLLSEGHDVWGAIASSDFHNFPRDAAPCDFSRIHLSVDEFNYDGVIKALRAGTFWADHGKFLKQFKMFVDIDDLQQPAYSSAIIDNIPKESVINLHIKVEREKLFAKVPLEVDIIGNCLTGQPQLLDTIYLSPEISDVNTLLPALKEGTDNKSCYIRARVRKVNIGEPDFMAYTNIIRFIYH